MDMKTPQILFIILLHKLIAIKFILFLKKIKNIIFKTIITTAFMKYFFSKTNKIIN